MSVVTEKTGIPLGMVVTLGTMLVSIVSTAAVGHYRLGATERDIAQLKVHHEDAVRQQAEIALQDAQAKAEVALRFQGLELGVKQVNETLVRIEKSLERQERRNRGGR